MLPDLQFQQQSKDRPCAAEHSSALHGSFVEHDDFSSTTTQTPSFSVLAVWQDLPE
jgi:hypothetical protein